VGRVPLGGGSHSGSLADIGLKVNRRGLDVKEKPTVDIAIYDLTPTLSANLADPVQTARVWDEAHAVATLQGIVNRTAPRLYLRYVEHDGVNIDDYWLRHLRAAGRWLSGRAVRPITGLEALVEHFRADLAGAVVYDPRLPALSNVASTIAGVENLIAIRHDPAPGSAYDRLVVHGPRLNVARRLWANTFDANALGSAKCAAYAWARREFIDTSRCDPRYLGYYIDAWWIHHAHHSVANHHTLTNHDYFVAKRAFFCDLNCWSDEVPVDDPRQPVGADLRTLQDILLGLYRQRGGRDMLHVGGFTPWAFKYTDLPQSGGTHHGVQSEWELVRLVSAYDGFLDADAIGHGAMANASFYMHFPLAADYTQTRADAASSTDVPRPALVSTTGKRADPADLDWVMFYVGDYDAAAWMYQRMPDLWADPRRGEVPLSWAFSPVLARRVPMVFDYLWRTRSVNDFFMAADNGAGYLNPAMLVAPRPLSGLPSGVENWRAHCAAHYARWDMDITGFIIDGRAPQTPDEVLDAYATFSPAGVVMQYDNVDYRLHGEMPVLRRGPDIGGSVAEAIASIRADIAERRSAGMRFHWYRSILQSPTWHAEVSKRLGSADSRIRIVGAPELFSRLRRYLKSQ
jgi:hypothetical protein